MILLLVICKTPTPLHDLSLCHLTGAWSMSLYSRSGEQLETGATTGPDGMRTDHLGGS